ncbi:MAG TPA: hypothetical protein VEQ16_11650 [Acidocella sp.]|nr:hypothetical protein [Acidocella sp.]
MSFLMGLGGFGSGLSQGMTQGLGTLDKILDYQAEARLAQDPAFAAAISEQLGTLGGLGSIQQFLSQQPSPGGQSGAASQAAQPPPAAPQAPGTMAGAFPPMQTAMQMGQPAVAPGQPGGAQRQPFPLAVARDPVHQELESTPGLKAQLDRITTAEVGRDPQMQKMFQETVINRAAADKIPLAKILSDRNYFPPATFLRAQREGGTGQGVSPEMWASTAPSNLTGYGTGNASIDPRTGRPVGFAGGPQTAMRGGEQYGIEGRNLPWARSMGYGGPERTALGRAGPQGPGGQAPVPPTVDHGELAKATTNLREGKPMPMNQLAQLIERNASDASPLVKFRMMKKALGLMNSAGQTQFNQAMQIMQFRQREQQHEDVLKHQRTMEELAAGRQDPEKQAALAAAKKGATAIIQSRQRELSTLNTQLGAIEGQTQNMLGNIDRLAAIAKEVQITGSMPIDTWINNIKAKFGNTNALMYKAQLDTTRLDVSRVLNNPTGNAALTEGARKEAQAYLNGVLTPKTIAAFKELYRVDAKIKRESLTNQIKAAEKDIEEYGGHRTTEPAETTAGQAAPATSRKIDREKAKAAGWSDAEIDAYERGQ